MCDLACDRHHVGSAAHVSGILFEHACGFQVHASDLNTSHVTSMHHS